MRIVWQEQATNAIGFGQRLRLITLLSGRRVASESQWTLPSLGSFTEVPLNGHDLEDTRRKHMYRIEERTN